VDGRKDVRTGGRTFETHLLGPLGGVDLKIWSYPIWTNCTQKQRQMSRGEETGARSRQMLQIAPNDPAPKA